MSFLSVLMDFLPFLHSSSSFERVSDIVSVLKISLRCFLGGSAAKTPVQGGILSLTAMTTLKYQYFLNFILNFRPPKDCKETFSRTPNLIANLIQFGCLDYKYEQFKLRKFL